MIDLARRAGAERVILNGSFVTNIMEPNDVDCVVLLRRRGPQGRAALRELRNGLPFLDIAITGPKRFSLYVNRLFAADRDCVAKGMVEVALDAPQ